VLVLQQDRHVGISKHSRAISLLNREFIKTGIFDKEYSNVLPRAIELCQKVDYIGQPEVTLAGHNSAASFRFCHSSVKFGWIFSSRNATISAYSFQEGEAI